MSKILIVAEVKNSEIKKNTLELISFAKSKGLEMDAVLCGSGVFGQADVLAGQGASTVYLGDDLFACQPIAEATLAAGGDFIFTCKRDSHKTLYRHVDEGTPKTFKLNRNGRIFKYKWMKIE